MEQTVQVSFAALAAVITLLIGVVGWIYWQQTRLFANMNGIIMVIGELSRQQQQAVPEPEPEKPVPEPVVHQEEEEDEDDRLEVEPEVVEGPPPPIDTDTLDEKTSAELNDMLTKRGIPFGKRDAKTVLVALLKATA